MEISQEYWPGVKKMYQDELSELQNNGEDNEI